MKIQAFEVYIKVEDRDLLDDTVFLELADLISAVVGDTCDAPMLMRDGNLLLDVTREAPSLQKAIDRTIREIQTIEGLEVVRVNR